MLYVTAVSAAGSELQLIDIAGTGMLARGSLILPRTAPIVRG